MNIGKNVYCNHVKLPQYNAVNQNIIITRVAEPHLVDAAPASILSFSVYKTKFQKYRYIMIGLGFQQQNLLLLPAVVFYIV
jgi:hypothetical protein